LQVTFLATEKPWETFPRAGTTAANKTTEPAEHRKFSLRGHQHRHEATNYSFSATQGN